MRALAAVALAGALGAAGCRPQRPPVITGELQRCYAEVDAETQRRIDAECPGPFADCPTASAILDDMRRAQEACP